MMSDPVEPWRKSLPPQPRASYVLRLDEVQASVVSQACELLARLHLGQFDELASVLGADTEGVMNALPMLDNLRELLLRGSGPVPSIYDTHVAERARTAWDIHQVVRLRLAMDRRNKGLMSSDEDMPIPADLRSLPRMDRDEDD